MTKAGREWQAMFGELRGFRKKHGHLKVPMAREPHLARWLARQRASLPRLTPDQGRALHELGVSFGALDDRWVNRFCELRDFWKKHGHCLVPIKGAHASTLGNWVGTQRQYSNALAGFKRRWLATLGFVWNVLEALWQQLFAELVAFKKEHGHLRPPVAYGATLFNWVNRLRRDQKKLSPAQRSQLQKIGFVWTPFEDDRLATWMVRYPELRAFAREHGHCNIPNTDAHRDLRQWVRAVRYGQFRITPEQRRRLDALDFEWHYRENRWERHFQAAVEFRRKHGHARVPVHCPADPQLGHWVDAQRQHWSRLTSRQRERLLEVGFMPNVFDATWEKRFQQLKDFRRRLGHLDVPRTGAKPDKLEAPPGLREWVNNQRQKAPPERWARLEKLGVPRETKPIFWQKRFAEMQVFVARHGHARVPRKMKHLYGWVWSQKHRTEMPEDQRRLLKKAGVL